MSTDSTVYTGIWMNHSKGSILGATLTVAPGNGLIVVAILALFVSLAGSQSWGMIRFVVHQLRATTHPSHGIYYQQQAILRNTGVASAAIWQFGKIAWVWRSRGMKSFQKSIVLIILGLTHLLFFLAAGVLSSRLATVSSEVLVRSPNCGSWDALMPAQLMANVTESVNYLVHRRENADLSMAYVRDCFGGYQTSPQCNTFIRQELPFTTVNNASCPFNSKMCLGPENGAITFTTGLLDSLDDLGVNSQKDRVLYRKSMTCSPIVTEGYTSNGSSSLNGRGYNYTALYYGPNLEMNSSEPAFGGLPNATYVHTDYKSLALGFDYNLENERYSLETMQYPAEIPDFDPIPELLTSSGTVTLLFVSFDGVYLGESDDLWFSAHHLLGELIGTTTSNDTLYSTYGFDKPVSTLGCIEQYQLCNPKHPENSDTRCTPWLAAIDLSNFNISNVLDTKNQLEIANLIFLVMLNTQLKRVVDVLSTPLLASSNMMSAISAPIPPNQWTLEAANWFATSINLLQRGLAEDATGLPSPYSKYTANAAANDPALKWFCDNFIMRDNRYTSFSILAISFVLGVGGLIIILSLYFESIIGWMQVRWKRGIYRRVYWKLDSVLQLQRMAYEEAGLGAWERCGHEVPVTAEKIQVATEWDAWHPTIRGKAVSSSESQHQSTQKDRQSKSSDTLSEVQTVVSRAESKTQASVTNSETLSEVPTAVSEAESKRQASVAENEIVSISDLER
ncbi:uncharacterized protein LY89DRAFT_790396 [Mollisia scopiformis]|uniref:Uncharacterized protein n=1 Tax=Mollisia scopiformis TaxID=149040 RepID=A0A132B2B0_MOLSC|nr:uncharacterized protein LY89DRAFT_790396 [Mollisia scopiformis]KUJ06526.1 hypothetical protein LY89DRAFT_790396 [Mollisia scopiformis]